MDSHRIHHNREFWIGPSDQQAAQVEKETCFSELAATLTAV